MASGTPSQTGRFPGASARYETCYFDGAVRTRAVRRRDRRDQVELDLQLVETVSAASFGTPSPLVSAVGLRPSPTDRLTSLPPQAAQSPTYEMLATSDITDLRAPPGRIDGPVEVTGEPNRTLFFALGWFFFIPAIVKWMTKAKIQRDPVVLMFAPGGEGTRVAVQAQGHALERIAPELAQPPW